MAYRDLASGEAGESSAKVRARVEAARSRQRIRDPRPNATLPTRALAEVVQLDSEANRLMERAVDRLALSARAIDRVRRVAPSSGGLERAPPGLHNLGGGPSVGASSSLSR
jgi:magnesium chelatase family protein